MKEFDWSQPQRQPLAGLLISFLHTFWEVLKRFWPLALLMLLGKENKTDRYELMGIVLLVVTLVPAIFRYLYFKFYLEDDKLIVKKGWINKETQVIPLERIQTVNIEQGLLHQLLNIVKVSIDTAGSQNAEATIEALQGNMARALKEKLLDHENGDVPVQTRAATQKDLLMKLGFKDLLKLSLSANHLEAFFILLSFGFGIYENIKDFDNSLLPGTEDLPSGSVTLLLSLIVVVLIVTLLVSTTRIFFRFYGFSLFRISSGYQIRSGLTNIRERLIAIKKIQFVSWRANWIRKLLGLWILQYHVTGGEELKSSLKVEVPLTQKKMAAELIGHYYPIQQLDGLIYTSMHFSFVIRRLLFTGLLPSMVLAVAFWWLIGLHVIFFFMLPLIVFLFAWCSWKKFRAYPCQDILLIRKGILGEQFILVQWHKLQSVTVSQTLFQRRKGLAKLAIHTAGGSIYMHFIPVKAARQMANYALFKTGVDQKGWM